MANTPSKRTTPRKSAAAKKTATPRKAAARKQVAGTKQQQARQLTARQKVAQGVRDIEEARAAAQDMEVTSAEEWLADTTTAEVGVPTKLQVPSGKVCLAINKGMMSFVGSGKIPNPLMEIVMGAVNEGKGLPTQGLKDLVTGDKAADMLAGMVEMVDAITVECVLQPVVHPVPPPVPSAADPEVMVPGERKPGLLYVDVVDLDDKMFLFNWVVGGTRDIQRFREQSAAAMAALQQEGVGQ